MMKRRALCGPMILVLGLCVMGCVGTRPAASASTAAKPAVPVETQVALDPLLGLPPLPVPDDNPMSEAKIALGDKLFHDERFSSDGSVSCATCHERTKAFTDSPLSVSEGIMSAGTQKLTGTRNAPTVLNAAFNATQFWDGRSPDLEDQSLHPFTNPVEMGLKDHKPILELIRRDAEYRVAFKEVFGISPNKVTMGEVTKAIAAFERTAVSGNSRFDRWYFADEATLSDEEIAGFNVFVEKGRCVSCHVVEHTSALFTDHRFHNVGVGINRLPRQETEQLVEAFIAADYTKAEVDIQVLKDAKTSEIGRVAVTRNLTDIGSFKTPTLRNIELTAPYMHDGSVETLEDVVEHYNRGGASEDDEPINHFLSGGIRPLDLTDTEKENLVAFLKTLTSPSVVAAAKGEE